MNTQPYYLFISPKTRFLNFLRKFFIFTGTDKLIANYTRKANINSLPSKLVPPNYLYTLGTFRSCTINGINYSVDVSDTNGHQTYYDLGVPSQNVLFSNIREGMNIIDIGANIGALTLQFASKVSPTGKVFSFEPSPVNFRYASKNISINSFNNIKLINEGLGNERTSAFLYNVNPNNRGMLRLLQPDENNNFEKEEVQIDTLDNSMLKFSLPAPDFIKIDVEGFEYKILQGAFKTLVNHKPMLFIELDDNNLREQNSNAKELIMFLNKLNYHIKNAETNEEINESSNFVNCHFDILCV